MRAIEDFADERHKAWCLYCCQALAGNVVNRDHVPSKVLLDRPLPDNLPVVRVCAACNNGHSLDEEYFIAFLGVVLSGSTKPQDQTIDRARAVLEHNPGLAERIETTRSSIEEGDESRLYWHPEAERIHRVILKNARGHVYYDFGEPMLSAPSSLWAVPLVSLSDESRENFEAVLDETGESLAGWPEVGSRAMNRLFLGVDMIDGWTIVQKGIYRYAVIQDGTGYVVRILIREYLAAEVAWSERAPALFLRREHPETTMISGYSVPATSLRHCRIQASGRTSCKIRAVSAAWIAMKSRGAPTTPLEEVHKRI